MAQTPSVTLNPSMTGETGRVTVVDKNHLLNQAYYALQIGFIAAPALAGADKFFNILTNWEQYLAPQATQITGLSALTFMHIVGIVELIAAIGVLLKPKIFGYVVMAWLAGIILNLLLLGNYYDIALRDLGLAIGAFALARLAVIHDRFAVKD